MNYKNTSLLIPTKTCGQVQLTVNQLDLALPAGYRSTVTSVIYGYFRICKIHFTQWLFIECYSLHNTLTAWQL